MSNNLTCPECGAERADGNLGGLCPKCLARYSFLELEGKAGNDTVKLDAEVERSGLRIGRYKLLEQIGEGGFGLVYMAEQIEPVQRKVALKVIKAGMDTKAVVARFEAERQALAMMDHPNIARVLDAGTTKAGRPYFVMELVRGLPITEFCDLKKVSTAGRLNLFITVCQAVQHAHQKGIIHRDLKPSNVLVTLHDGKPVPKVIDFGVAKALGQRLTDKTLFTGFAHMIGTPAYMSPEQAELSGLDIDTRSDIYSLGVLLYELLTGVTPFDRETLSKAAFDEVRRMIREVEPVKPSTRLTQERLHSAASGKSAIRIPQSAIDRDLDWIVMKCLEKDRARRYETANGVASDVQRHLNDEPIMARPPSKLYEFQKTVKRHKVGFITAGSVMVALLVGLALATVAWAREREARAQATLAEQNALAEAQRSKQVAQFLEDMLEAVQPSVARGRDTQLLREVLDKTVERVEQELADQPEIQGDLWLTLGKTYVSIGDRELGVVMLARAIDCYKIEPGIPNPKLAQTLGLMGFHQSYLQQIEAGESNAALGLEMAQKLGDLKTLASCYYYRGRACYAWGKGGDHGRPYYEKALEIYRQLGDHPLSEAKCLSILAVCNIRDQESVAMARRALEIRSEHYDPDHTTIAETKFVLGQVLICQGEVEEAEQILMEALRTWEQVQQNGEPHKHILRRFAATALAMQGKWNEADEVLRENPGAGGSIELKYRKFYITLVTRLRWLDRRDDADAALKRMRADYETLLSVRTPDDRDVKDYCRDLFTLYEDLGQFEEAVALLTDYAERYLARVDAGPTEDASELNEAAWTLMSVAKPDLAKPQLALQLAKRAAAVDSTNGTYLNTLGVAYYRVGNFSNTIGVLQRLIDSQFEEPDYNSFYLAMALWHVGRKEQARRAYDQAAKWMTSNKADDAHLLSIRAEAAALLGIDAKITPN